MNQDKQPRQRSAILRLPRNVWAVGLTSFFMDISSEMVINILPLFLANVLGVQTAIIGLIEGVAEATASILKLFSGWLSDKIGGRKWLAVAGYGLSALTKPFFYFATTWEMIAVVRWADRVGKGIRTAPRDALVADSVTPREARPGFRLSPRHGYRRRPARAAHRPGSRVAGAEKRPEPHPLHLPDRGAHQPAASLPGGALADHHRQRRPRDRVSASPQSFPCAAWDVPSPSSWSSSASSPWATRQTPSWCCAPRTWASPSPVSCSCW